MPQTSRQQSTMIEHAAINGTETAYRARRHRAGLLLLHGGEGSHAMFDRLAALLVDRFTVILYDQRDCGDTRSRPDVAVGLELLADDAHALVLHLGYQRVHVFGTSFGGRLAQILALRHPQVIDRLVLGSTWPVPQTLAQLDPEGRARINALRQGLPERRRSWRRSSSTFRLRARPGAEGPVQERRPRLGSLAPARRGAGRQPGGERGRHPGADAAALRRARPGREPGFTLGMAQLIPQAEHVLLPDVGHSTLQAPELVSAELKRFLLR